MPIPADLLDDPQLDVAIEHADRILDARFENPLTAAARRTITDLLRAAKELKAARKAIDDAEVLVGYGTTNMDLPSRVQFAVQGASSLCGNKDIDGGECDRKAGHVGDHCASPSADRTFLW